MKTIQRKFIIQLFIISVVLYAGLYLIFTKYIPAEMPLLAMVALLFAINAAGFIIISNTKEKKPSSFVYSFMIVSVVRMLICAAFVVAYALIHRNGAKYFLLAFFLLYIIFITAEVKALSAVFKSKKE